MACEYFGTNIVVIVKPGKLETLRLLFNSYDTVDY